MAKKIKLEQIVQKDLFQNTVDSANKLLYALNENKEALIALGREAKKNIAKLKIDNLKGLEAFTQKTKEIDTLQRELGETTKKITSLEKALAQARESNAKQLTQRERLLKQQAAAQRKLSDNTQQGATRLAELRVQTQEQNNVLKQQARESLGLVGAYEKLSRKLNDTRKRYKDVAASEGEASKNARRLAKEVSLLDGRLKRIDASAGQFQRNVGNYKEGLRSLGNILGAAGVTLGAAGFFRVVRNGITIIKDFEKENAVLAGVLDTTRAEIKDLTNDAVRLGSTTVKTAQEVTQLQTAYARLGFSQKEILDLTGDTINGSIALNATLDETAELTGAVIKTFESFSTGDAEKVLDQLTASTQQSALNFEKLQTALPIVGGAANAAGIPFNKLLALLGKLSDSGIDASSSATALRNIIIESSSKGKNYEEILEDIVKSQDKLTASNDEFGKRAAVSATILSQNIALTDELAKSLEKSGGTAERVAREQLATLDGATQLLKSAWEGFILSLNDGDGISRKLSLSIAFLAQNLGIILKIIGLATSAFIVYKSSVLIANNAVKAYSIIQKTASLATSLFTKRTKQATVAVKVFDKTTKTTLIGAFVSLLFSAITALTLFREKTEDATTAQREFNEAFEEGVRLRESVKSIENQILRINVLNKEQLKQLKQNIETEISLNEAKGAKIIQNEDKISKTKQKIIEGNNKAIIGLQKKLENATDQILIDDLNRQIVLIKETNKDILENAEDVEEGITSKQIEENRKRLDSYLELVKIRINSIKDQQEEESGLLEDVNEKIKEQNELLLQAKSIDEIGRIQKVITELENLKNEYLGVNEARRLQLEQDIDQILIQREIDRLQKQVENEEIAAEERIRIAELLYENKRDLLIDQAEFESAQFKEGSEEQRKIQEQLTNELINLEQEKRDKIEDINDQIIEDEKKLAKQRLENAITLIEQIANAIDEAIGKRFEKEKELLNKELEAREQSEQRQIELAENGSNAQILFERGKIAELEKERQNLEKRQQLARQTNILVEGYLNAFSSRAKEDPQTAPTKALADVTKATALKTAVSGLVGFFKGTEKVSDDAPRMLNTGRDDYIVRLDGGEGVATTEANQRYEGLIGAMNRGNVEQWMLEKMVASPELIQPITREEKNSTVMLNRLEKIEQAINNKPVYMGSDILEWEKMMRLNFKQGNKIEHKYRSIKL